MLTNEYWVILKLITRSGSVIGAGVDDMLDALGLPEDVGRHHLFRRLSELEDRLLPLGMTIRYNPIGRVFYLDTKGTVDSLSDEEQLPDRLAATLLTVITLAYRDGGWVPMDQVRDLRRKTSRSVLEDLRELAKQQYVEIDKARKRVRPGPRVPFEVDFEAFFQRLSEEKTPPPEE
ncbi:MAG: hypothetical protein C4K47_07275 [Candidatus Thorarchaeota archaeon]|nr:MAG: hypothetical protein C4K47_07275 [Candidatus Thorarchaeota archaeon]